MAREPTMSDAGRRPTPGCAMCNGTGWVWRTSTSDVGPIAQECWCVMINEVTAMFDRLSPPAENAIPARTALTEGEKE